MKEKQPANTAPCPCASKAEKNIKGPAAKTGVFAAGLHTEHRLKPFTEARADFPSDKAENADGLPPIKDDNAVGREISRDK